MVTTHLFLKCDEFMNDKTYNIKKKKKTFIHLDLIGM